MQLFQIPSHIQTLQAYEPGKPIEETQRELGISDVIKLASNENPLGPPPLSLIAMQKAMNHIHLYPDGSAFHLKTALSRRFGVEMEELLIGNGSVEVIEIILRTLAQPGRNVVIGWPSFIAYHNKAHAAGLEVKHVSMPHYQYDVDLLISAVNKQTCALIVGHANNPTGCYIPQEQLLKLIKCVPQSVIIIVDEAYIEYADAADYQSVFAYRQPNVVITRTFSKAYGLAGIRVGFAIADKQFLNFCQRVREPFNVNSLAFAAAIGALEDSQHLEKTLHNHRQQKAWLWQELKNLGLDVIASQGNFFLIDFHRPALPIYQALLHAGVIVRPLQPYQLPNALRMSIGLPEENIKLIENLRQVIEK